MSSSSTPKPMEPILAPLSPSVIPPPPPSSSSFSSSSSPSSSNAAEGPTVPQPTSRSNPGSIEQLHREVRETLATLFVFEGAKFELQKPLSNTFQITHSFRLGANTLQTPNFYSFGAVFGGSKDQGFVMGDIDTEGNMSGRSTYALAPKLNFKTVNQITNQGSSHVFELEHNGSDSTTSVKCINPDILNGSGIGIFSYLQSVTKRIALGVEGTWQRGPQMAESSVTLVGRYTARNGIFTANLASNGSLQASYFHKVSNVLSMGAELEGVANSMQRESVFTMGARYDFRASTFRAQIDTHGRIASHLEQRFVPGLSFVLSGELDHVKGQSRFGVGLVVGQ